MASQQRHDIPRDEYIKNGYLYSILYHHCLFLVRTHCGFDYQHRIIHVPFIIRSVSIIDTKAPLSLNSSP